MARVRHFDPNGKKTDRSNRREGAEPKEDMRMGMMKVEVSLSKTGQVIKEFRKNRMQALDRIEAEILLAVGKALDQFLKEEMTLFLSRPDQSDNKRTGYQERECVFKGLGRIQVRMPMDRKREFQSVIIPSKEQLDPNSKNGRIEFHRMGVSTRMSSTG